MELKKNIVYHVGARDKYSIAKYFLKNNTLYCFLTDVWYKSIFNLFPASIKNKVARRFDRELNEAAIYSYSLLKVLLSFFKRNNTGSTFNRWINHDKEFTKFVISNIRSKKPSLIWGFTNANLEVLEYFKDQPIIKVHNQIDPGLEYYVVKEELWRKYHDIESNTDSITSEFKDRILREWELADIIVVNSEYAKRSLIKYGVPETKIIVLPLIYEAKNIYKFKSINFKAKLNIGFVGNINVIKGFTEFIEAAKSLHPVMNFFAVGNILINEQVVDKTREYIIYKGHLTKEEMENFYKDLDILVFPTYSDGFGMVQLEAMSYGIPVLSTVNCGEVVEDGKSGFIIDNSAESIAEKLDLLNNDRKMLEKMSQSCLTRIKDFNTSNFEKRLKEEFAKKNISI